MQFETGGRSTLFTPRINLTVKLLCWIWCSDVICSQKHKQCRKILIFLGLWWSERVVLNISKFYSFEKWVCYSSPLHDRARFPSSLKLPLTVFLAPEKKTIQEFHVFIMETLNLSIWNWNPEILKKAQTHVTTRVQKLNLILIQREEPSACWEKQTDGDKNPNDLCPHILLLNYVLPPWCFMQEEPQLCCQSSLNCPRFHVVWLLLWNGEITKCRTSNVEAWNSTHAITGYLQASESQI